MNIISQNEGPKETEVKHKGKMVVEGVDASQGQCDDDHSGDWKPAVSRKTQTKFLRRKAKRDALAEQKLQQDQEFEENAKIASEASSVADDVRSEQPLSESSIACITGDYAMQNVILQMGLRLIAPGGMQIRQLNRWTWKCHACPDVVTPDFGTGFCPKCENGGTLRKVALTIDENGTTVAARTPRITLRGTKFSIPMPKGGREGITQNMILREDQLPRNSLHSKTKKKASRLGDDYFVSEDVFLNHHSYKRAPYQPPVRTSMAVFSQKRTLMTTITLVLCTDPLVSPR